MTEKQFKKILREEGIEQSLMETILKMKHKIIDFENLQEGQVRFCATKLKNLVDNRDWLLN